MIGQCDRSAIAASACAMQRDLESRQRRQILCTTKRDEAWRVHPEHAQAKRHGTQSFFSEYKFQICNVIRERAWAAGARADAERVG